MIKTINLQKIFKTEEVETWALNNGHSCISPWQYNHVIQRLWTL